MALQVKPVLGFKTQSDQQIATTASAVIKEMTGNPAFPNPPVELKAVQAAVDELNAAMAAQVQGGTAATAVKKNKRDSVVTLLRKLAHYVHDNCGNDPAVLLSSGFQLATSSRARYPLAKPSILSIDPGNSTELVLKVSPIANARCYDVQFAQLGANSAPGGLETRRTVHQLTLDQRRQPDPRNDLRLPGSGCRRQYRLQRLERSGRPHVHVAAASPPGRSRLREAQAPQRAASGEGRSLNRRAG